MIRNADILLCPVCESALTPTTVAAVVVDRCDRCLGCWFDAAELSTLLHSTEPAATDDSGSAPPINIRCPRCRTDVPSSIYAHDSGIPINKCSQCAGVWLRNGQLPAIAKYKLGSTRVNALADAMAKEIAPHPWSRLGRFAQSRLLSSLVAAAILSIAWINTGRVESVMRLLIFLLLPLVCIWFPQAMGRLTGISLGLFRPRISERTPGIAVALGGWLLLATVLIVMIYGMN